MRKCLISGSFDPITKGHEEVIKRAKKLFDKVYVCIFENPEKSYAFSLETRLDFIKTLFEGDDQIVVTSHEGLAVNFVKENEIDAVVRGIRNATDFEYEVSMEQVNKHLDKNFECVYLSASPSLTCVSSSFVRQLLKFDGDISFAIPEKIIEKVKEDYKNK